MFNPVRRRILKWVDRRFYRSRHDAERVVEEFSYRFRDRTDMDRLAGAPQRWSPTPSSLPPSVCGSDNRKTDHHHRRRIGATYGLGLAAWEPDRAPGRDQLPFLLALLAARGVATLLVLRVPENGVSWVLLAVGWGISILAGHDL